MPADSKKDTLEAALDRVEVQRIDDHHTEMLVRECGDKYAAISDWYMVIGDDGVIAYFAHESDALRFRLAEVNRLLNG